MKKSLKYLISLNFSKIYRNAKLSIPKNVVILKRKPSI